ncbi:Rab GTPase-binding effector protein 1 [Dirofilaria immitis]|nr:Rab GTPase-binding effector protein 1 [Dirofilaria immitis]
MSVENLDVLMDGEVLINKLSNNERNDTTATSVLESAIENHGKWIIQKENNSSNSVNEENKTIRQASDTVCEDDIIPTSCEMCHNYELNLTKMQDAERNLREQLSAAQHLIDRYQNELSGERLYRKEMEAKTATLCADNEKKCLKLIEEQRNNIGLLKERLNMMKQKCRDLSSRYLEVMLKDEITTLEAQRKEDEMEKRRIEDDYTERVNGVSQELGFARSQLDSMKDASSKVEEMNKRMTEYMKVIEDLEKELQSVQKERNDLEMTVALYKQKCATLQHELDTSEAVQKDFVKLSQNLQIELEKIRQAEQEVRWQFDEDVHACNQCETNFSKNRNKLHCYHCGKIFCSVCLTATIPSGPHRRPAKVCQVCHTLLSRIFPYLTNAVLSDCFDEVKEMKFASVIAFIINMSISITIIAAKTKSVGVSGTIICDGKPRWMQGHYLRRRKQMSRDDSESQEAQKSIFNPQFTVSHKCRSKLCTRRMYLPIPEKYSTFGSKPREIFDIGVIEVKTKFPTETRICPT